jgi:hypothetical protein
MPKIALYGPLCARSAQGATPCGKAVGAFSDARAAPERGLHKGPTSIPQKNEPTQLEPKDTLKRKRRVEVGGERQ